MATSGSDNWSTSRDDIIKDALAWVTGRIDQTPTGRQYVHASRLLNDLVKSIDADGKFLWRAFDTSLSTLASTGSYAISATYLDVDNVMRFVEAGASTASLLTRMTWDEYRMIPNQTEESRTPTRFAVRKDLASDGRVQQTVYLWPEPSTAGDAVYYTAYTRGEDFDAGADAADFPQAWILCLKFGLASVLAPAYRQPSLFASFDAKYRDEKQRLIGDDNERGDLVYVPFGNITGYT